MSGARIKVVGLPPEPFNYLYVGVGDIGYVTRLHYPQRLVAVRFPAYGGLEMWVRAEDVEILRDVVVPMTACEVLARRNEGAIMHELAIRGYAIEMHPTTGADKQSRRSPRMTLHYMEPSTTVVRWGRARMDDYMKGPAPWPNIEAAFWTPERYRK